MNELFEPKNEHPYHPRDVSQFITPSVYIVLRASLFCDHKMWNLLPKKLKDTENLKDSNRLKI